MAYDPHMPANLPPVTYAPRPPRLRRPPFAMVSIGLVAVVASWLPLVLFARARVTPSNAPRVQLAQDMGTQPKFREQQSNDLFSDGRADRLPVPGTVARGHLEADDHYYRGYTRVAGADGKTSVKFDDAFPQQVKLTPELLKRGQDRFYIYCSVCHGLDGSGHGQVNERALELQQQGGAVWTQAATLTADAIRARPVGHIYNTVNVGIRSMPGYGAQVPVEDRWAIVAYVRALQLSQNAPQGIASAPAPGAGQ